VSFWDSAEARTWLTNTVTFLLFVPVILLIASRGRFWIRTLRSKQLAERVRAGGVAACNRLSDFWTGLCKPELGAGNISDFTAAAAVGGDPFGSAGNSMAIAAIALRFLVEGLPRRRVIRTGIPRWRKLSPCSLFWILFGGTTDAAGGHDPAA